MDLTYWPTKSKEHIRSSEDNSYTPTQKIPHILRNPKVHYRIHNTPSIGHFFSQINPVISPILFLEYPF
jgi:hypothetical protein